MKYCEDCKWFGIEEQTVFLGLVRVNKEVCLHATAAYDGDGIKNNFRSLYIRRPIRIRHWPASLMRSAVFPGDRCGESAQYFEAKDTSSMKR